MYFSHTKRLIGALAVSGFLNIMLLTSMFYWSIKERSPALYCDQKPLYKAKTQAPLVAEETISQLIQRMKKYPYEQLVGQLRSTAPVDNGYTERDIALAILVGFHHFDLNRALGSPSYVPQERLIAYGRLANGSPALIKIYPALSNTHFATVLEFATTERWPQTSQGLFLLLQKKIESVENSLLDAFFMTPEFLAIEPLFRRSETPVGRVEIISVLLQGDWNTLTNIYEQQKIYGDVSEARRQNILLTYVLKGSQAAANLLLQIDGLFALKKLEDAHVLSLLEVLTEKKPQNEKFALSILLSPRSDAVRKKAAERLYGYAGEQLPDNFHYRAALKRFVAGAENLPSKEKAKPPTTPLPIKVRSAPIAAKPLDTIRKMAAPPKADRLYIIQEGDNLWKISRRFNVDVEVLKKHNKLTSSTLAPGAALRIPTIH